MVESKINVTVRVKPLSKSEDSHEKNHLWKKVSDNTLMNSRTKEMFSFDQVFGPEVSTETIFDSKIKDLVHNAMGGINQTVFAYGQTSSGKTFTMRGPDPSKNISNESGQVFGLIPLSIKEIFTKIDHDEEKEYKVSVSYMEVSVQTALKEKGVEAPHLNISDLLTASFHATATNFSCLYLDLQ